jgi:hypothetical protein
MFAACLQRPTRFFCGFFSFVTVQTFTNVVVGNSREGAVFSSAELDENLLKITASPNLNLHFADLWIDSYVQL